MKNDDIEPVPDAWHAVGKFMIGAILATLMLCAMLIFATGVFIWSLVI